MAGVGEWRFIGEMVELASYTMSLLLLQVRNARRDFIAPNLERCKPATKSKRADVFCDVWVYAVRNSVMQFAGNAEPSQAATDYITGEHLGEREIHVSQDCGLPAGTTLEPPPTAGEGRQNVWELVLNIRGTVFQPR